MHIVSIHTPAPVRTPRFAPLAAEMAAGLLQWLADSRRALVETRRLSERQRQARELRQFAQRHASHDPRFAADLLAAADRHERDA